MIIGLTGGISSGKSTVSSYLSELGAAVIDSDKIAHNVLKDPFAYNSIISKFGSSILDDNAMINRSYLGEIVFNNPDKRKELEKITHPLIISKIHKKIEEYLKKNRIIILDAPLLFEANLDKIVDQTWVVYVDKNTQIQRLMNRNNLNYKEAKIRIESQLSLEEKRLKADVVINNTGSIEALKADVLTKWRDFDEN